jgi:hypothetical protein
MAEGGVFQPRSRNAIGVVVIVVKLLKSSLKF